MRDVYAKGAHLILAANNNNSIDPDGVCRLNNYPSRLRRPKLHDRIRTRRLIAPRLQEDTPGQISDGGPHEITAVGFFAPTTNSRFQPSSTGQATAIRDRRGDGSH